MGINIGAFMSPLVAGTIGEIYGYQYGFLIASLGMILGLIIFLAWGKHLKGIGDPPAKKDDKKEMTPEEKIAHEKAVYEQTRPLDKKDYDRMFAIFILAFFVIAFWLAFEQAGSSLNVFAKRSTDRTVAPAAQTVLPDWLLIKNEDFLEFSALVQKVQMMSDQVDRAREGVVVEGPTFAERLSRYNIFRERQRDEFSDLPIEEQILRVKEQAETLRETLRTSRHPSIQEAIVQLNQVIETTDEAIADGATDGIAEAHRSAIEQAIVAMLVGEHGRYGEQIQIDLQTMDAAERRFIDQYEEGVEPRSFPATWYQSGNPLIVVVFAPIFIMLWSFLGRFGIEPSTPMKFAFGLLLMSIAFLMMIPGAIEAKYTGGRAAIYWLLLCFLFKTWGELCLSPIGLSMITKLSPKRYVSQFMGLWFCASSLSYFLAGYMASYYGSGEGVHFWFGEDGGLADFFLLVAIIPFIFGVVALFFVPTLKRKMHGIH
jgi:dipeptide/tripeptide permease